MAGFPTLKGSWPWPWPWIRSYCIPSCITHRPLPTSQISLKSKKRFVVGRTYARMYYHAKTQSRRRNEHHIWRTYVRTYVGLRTYVRTNELTHERTDMDGYLRPALLGRLCWRVALKTVQVKVPSKSAPVTQIIYRDNRQPTCGPLSPSEPSRPGGPGSPGTPGTPWSPWSPFRPPYPCVSQSAIPQHSQQWHTRISRVGWWWWW